MVKQRRANPIPSSLHPHQEKCLFTVLIITFNRAKLLRRALDSVARQDMGGIEVLVMDDGSNDDTREVVEKFKARTGIRVRYTWHENRGKPASYNGALNEIRGYFTMVLDSDDVLANGALQRLYNWWNDIPEAHRPFFAGVEGLCLDLKTGRVMGDPFPYSPMDSNFLETRYRYKITGDKRHIIRTDVMREFPFPLTAGEREMRESVIWCRMAHRYRFRYVNEVVQYCEQFPDGLSARPRERRLSSPNNFRLAFQDLINQHHEYLTPRDVYRAMVRYIRHSFCAGIGPRRQLLDLSPGKRPWWLLALAEGLAGALKDRVFFSNCNKRGRSGTGT